MRQDYFFVPAPFGERESKDAPIALNCAGLTDTCDGFLTDLPNGRKDYTLYYLHAGCFSIAFGDAPMTALDTGALILIPPNVRIYYRYDGGEPVKIYWAHFTGSYVEKILAESGIDKDGCIRAFPASGEAARVFQALLDEMKGPPSEAAMLRAAASLVLTLTALSRISVEGRHGRRLERSFIYLQEHFTENIRKGYLAEIEGLSVSQYDLLFRRMTGYTPTQYVTKLRVSLARKLLLESALTVGEIAESCGYDDPFYFCRVFTRESGISPSGFRKRKG